MPNVYVNGHGFLNINGRRTIAHPSPVWWYVTKGSPYDGDETQYLINGALNYPNRPMGVNAATEVQTQTTSGKSTFEHLLVSTGAEMVDVSRPPNNGAWVNRQRPPANLPHGVLHTLSTGDLLFVGSYRHIVKFNTLIREVNANTPNGGAGNVFHWTACREVIPEQSGKSDTGICNYLRGHLEGCGDRVLV